MVCVNSVSWTEHSGQQRLSEDMGCPGVVAVEQVPCLTTRGICMSCVLGSFTSGHMDFVGSAALGLAL